jgi:hypothetical protein
LRYFFFFVGLIQYSSFIAAEGGVEVGRSIFYDQLKDVLKHKHEGGEHHEEGKDDLVKVEEKHHHHHAHTQAAIVTAAPVVTSVRLPTGVVPLTSSQEVGLVKKTTTDDKSKPTGSISYGPMGAPISNDSIFFDDNVEIDQDPVTRFFTTDIWNDVIFCKSLLEEYNNFFDSEINHLTQAKKGLKKRKSEARESVISTPLFTEVLEKFKESNLGIQLQNQLESYIVIVARFIKAQKPQSRKVEISQSQKSPALEVVKLEKIAIVGDEVTSYALTYKGDIESPVYVTEKSMRLLFGQSFFNAFLTQQNLKNVTIFIPYKALLDVFNDKDRLFSLSLLRNKIYYTEPASIKQSEKRLSSGKN